MPQVQTRDKPVPISTIGLVLATGLLAAGFASVFDLVMIVTTWQSLRHAAADLAGVAVVSSVTEGELDLLWDRAADTIGPEFATNGRLDLSIREPDGTVRQRWHRGLVPASGGMDGQPASHCGPARSIVGEAAMPVSGWLVAPSVVRDILPGGFVARVETCRQLTE
jgi:hypothetical protein